jgi:hydrogenase/urease accessory protein HupE
MKNRFTVRQTSRIFRCGLILTLLWGVGATVVAHEVRPAYLQLHQTAAETYDVFWKVPGRGNNLRLSLYVQLPTNCRDASERRGVFDDNTFVEQWSVKCAGGLTGSTIQIAGLNATMTDVLVRLERTDGTTQVTRLTPAASSFTVEAAPKPTQVAATYLRLGVEHILTGWDHLLYILAMLLLVRGWRRVVLTMSAFTATHSLTLTAAALGWVHVPQRPVEACIALSILFVASEIVRAHQGQSGLTQRWPWMISFTFGLLHGFGFAGALSEVGLPQKAIPVALLFFNAGVEVGQLIFIASIFAIWILVRSAARKLTLPHPAWAWRIPPYAIGAVAAFWFLQRISLM